MMGVGIGDRCGCVRVEWEIFKKKSFRELGIVFKRSDF